jgi:hypothetical protein
MAVVVSRSSRFERTIPYQTPGSLADLRGPSTGRVRVRPRIDTSLDPVYDVSDPGDRWGLYSAVVRSGLRHEQETILNRDLLLAGWADLNLPVRCRAIWESAFPELAEVSRRKAS